MEETKRFRVAVIGCGAISGNHIRAILEAKQTLVALCDVDEAATQKKIEENNLEGVRVYTDYKTLLASEDLDAVHICTPHYLHAEMVTEALKRDVHVLCEKPLCISLEQLAAIRRAEKESTATLGVCLQNRYEPNMRKVKAMIDAGNAVEAAFGTVLWSRNEAYYRSGAWRGKWATEGGGVMINQALHTLDLLQWLCGFPDFVTGHAFTDRLSDVIEVEDTATALFEYKDGRTAHFFASVASGKSFPIQLVLRLSNREVWTVENDWTVASGGDFSVPQKDTPDGKAEWGNGHKQLISDFYRHLERGEKFPIDGEEGGKVIRMILALYASRGAKTAIERKETT